MSERDVMLLLRELRKEQGLTQADVARACGVTRSAVNHWERGESPLRMSAAQRYARALGMRIVLAFA